MSCIPIPLLYWLPTRLEPQGDGDVKAREGGLEYSPAPWPRFQHCGSGWGRRAAPPPPLPGSGDTIFSPGPQA